MLSGVQIRGAHTFDDRRLQGQGRFENGVLIYDIIVFYFDDMYFLYFYDIIVFYDIIRNVIVCYI
jgi:hypothetical protein